MLTKVPEEGESTGCMNLFTCEHAIERIIEGQFVHFNHFVHVLWKGIIDEISGNEHMVRRM